MATLVEIENRVKGPLNWDVGGGALNESTSSIYLSKGERVQLTMKQFNAPRTQRLLSRKRIRVIRELS